MRLIRYQIKFLRRFLRYYLKAATRYDVHSPFVSDFVENILEDRRQFYAFSDLELLRERLQRNHRILEVRDYGAGSKVQQSHIRTVADIVRNAAVSLTAGRWLFRLVHHYKPTYLLELGTSLGIGTLYLATPRLHTSIFTLEGCPQTAAIARENFESMQQSNITQLIGPFRERLPEALAEMERVDLLFLDGDHRLGASIAYVEQCLSKARPDSIFVLADIHWSAEMEKAWEHLRQHPRVRISIDLFEAGILFLREATRQQEHYTLIRARWKPWRMGFFPKGIPKSEIGRRPAFARLRRVKNRKAEISFEV